MPPLATTRRVTLEDHDALLRNVQAGFDSYAAFAPLGWQPPDVFADRDLTAQRLAEAGTLALMAVVEGDPVGHVSFFPARRRFPGRPQVRPDTQPTMPGVAHLWQLFVLPDWWGRGVAPLLHDAAIAELRARGYEAARLLTPSLHARARRFYERRGWSATEEEWNDGLALMLTEYRRPVSPAVATGSTRI